MNGDKGFFVAPSDVRVTMKSSERESATVVIDTAWLLEFLREKTKLMVETAEKKNADYTGGTKDPFANFSKVEALGIASTEQGFLTRMTDKLCRINSFVQRGDLKVKSESVEDTLIDLANYSLLLAAYIKSKELK